MLHRLIYVTAIAGVIHYIWLVKKDLRKPLIYAAILSVLLLYRVVVWIMERLSRRAHHGTAGGSDYPEYRGRVRSSPR